MGRKARLGGWGEEVQDELVPLCPTHGSARVTLLSLLKDRCLLWRQPLRDWPQTTKTIDNLFQSLFQIMFLTFLEGGSVCVLPSATVHQRTQMLQVT